MTSQRWGNAKLEIRGVDFGVSQRREEMTFFGSDQFPEGTTQALQFQCVLAITSFEIVTQTHCDVVSGLQ